MVYIINISCFKPKRRVKVPNYVSSFSCACNICGAGFSSMQALIEHSGGHDVKVINKFISYGRGTVKCMKCYRCFDNVYKLATDLDHNCIK